MAGALFTIVMACLSGLGWLAHAHHDIFRKLYPRLLIASGLAGAFIVGAVYGSLSAVYQFGPPADRASALVVYQTHGLGVLVWTAAILGFVGYLKLLSVIADKRALIASTAPDEE